MLTSKLTVPLRWMNLDSSSHGRVKLRFVQIFLFSNGWFCKIQIFSFLKWLVSENLIFFSIQMVGFVKSNFFTFYFKWCIQCILTSFQVLAHLKPSPNIFFNILIQFSFSAKIFFFSVVYNIYKVLHVAGVKGVCRFFSFS